MSELQTILVDILCALLIVALGYFSDRLRLYINNKELKTLVKDSVAAAEQTLKDGDDTGVERLQFVMELIKKAGYLITDEVRTLIEAAVYELNVNEKSVK